MKSFQVFVRGFFIVYYLVFGNPIRLTVIPEDSSPVSPVLFILSPAPPPEPQSEAETKSGPNVCLAANFRPKEGTMVLNDGSKSLKTDQAVLSTRQKTFFFAGFSQETIQSCKLHDSSTSLASETATVAATVAATVPVTVPATVPPLLPEKEPCTDCYPQRAKVNFYLLLFNGIRVVFTKAVAISTILTIRALLV